VTDTGGIADAANFVLGTLRSIDVGGERFENVRALFAMLPGAPSLRP